MSRSPIDPRAWLCWAGAAMLPPLMGRNPFALLSVLLAVIALRETLPADARSGWGWVIKLGVFTLHITVQLIHDCLNTLTTLTHTSTDWINVLIARTYRNF